MSDDYQCPRGCGTYQRLSRHWSGPNCEFPPLEADQRETIEGLLLAGATIAGNGPNKHLVTGTTHEPLSEWLADRLGWLSHSIRERDGGGNRDLEYRVRTHAHATLSRYVEWTEGDRRPPTDYDPTPYTARVWYALAGGLQWHGEYDSQRTATFSAKADTRAEWITDVLETAGFDPTRAGKRVQLRPKETTRFLEWIGEPVPGVLYKWAPTRELYEGAKDDDRPSEGSDEQSYTRAENVSLKTVVDALETVAARVDDTLTMDAYDNARDPAQPAASTIATKFGWNAAKRVAGLEIPSGTGKGYGPVSKQQAIDAVETIAPRIGGSITVRSYDDHRDPKHPAGYTIAERFGWDTIKQAANVEIPVGKGTGPLSKQQAADALETVAPRVDGKLTETAYDDHRDDAHPAAVTIANKFGWSDLKRELGLGE